MKGRNAIFAAAGLLMMAAPLVAGNHIPDFNGARSYAEANHGGAPIFRQFAFVEGVLTQYHVVMPESMFVDNHRSKVFQFPQCATLQPVLEAHHATPGDGGFQGPHDAPTKQIIDVILSTGCMVQPKSVAELQTLSVLQVETNLWVNVVKIAPQFQDYPDARLFNGPPFRPRVSAWLDGVPVKFVTYETSWAPTWLGTNFPARDADVFIISYEAVFRPDFTILNVAAGSPLTTSFQSYSPIWIANCIVDAINQKCGISVNEQAGYTQCVSVAECRQMVNPNTGLRVVEIKPSTFTHIDCPMVAVDLDDDMLIEPWEELQFPNVWVDGPVIV